MIDIFNSAKVDQLFSFFLIFKQNINLKNIQQRKDYSNMAIIYVIIQGKYTINY